MDVEGLMPVAGVDYPATFAQLLGWFPDDEACAAYLALLRWPEGVPLSTLCVPGRVADGSWVVFVPDVSVQDVGDGGHDLPHVLLAPSGKALLRRPQPRTSSTAPTSEPPTR